MSHLPVLFIHLFLPSLNHSHRQALSERRGRKESFGTEFFLIIYPTEPFFEVLKGLTLTGTDS